jgi:hypothetical protein
MKFMIAQRLELSHAVTATHNNPQLPYEQFRDMSLLTELWKILKSRSTNMPVLTDFQF